MSSTFDRSILDYLAKKENLALALEIGNYAIHLRRELLSKFWKSLQEAIIGTRPQGRPADEFIFAQSSRMDTQSASLRAIPKPATAQPQQIVFAVEHEQLSDKYDLYVGLMWTQQVPLVDPRYQQAPLKQLKQRLLAEGWIDWAPWWVCGRYVHQFPSLENFLCAWTDDPSGVINPLSAAFWDMVLKTESDVASINKLIATV